MDSINGLGTTTMTNRLHADNPGSILTRHPGSTPFGQELRKLLKFGNFETTSQQEILLFAADAMMFYQNIVEKNKDKLIICDRLNIVGALTYQLAGGSSMQEIKSMFKILKDLGWVMPVDKLLIFDAPYSVAQSRLEKPDLIDQDKVNGNKKDRFESRGNSYMLKVSENYRNIISAGVDIFDGLVKELFLIDASKNKEEVYEQITKVLSA